MAVDNIVNNIELVLSQIEQKIATVGAVQHTNALAGKPSSKLVDQIYLLHRGSEMLQFNYTTDELAGIIKELHKERITNFSSSPLSPPVSSILYNILEEGAQGPQGFINQVVATQGDRATYDAQSKGFTVYATSTGYTSSKQSDLNGDWGAWVPYTATGTPTFDFGGVDGGGF